jgi:hypothetical protein
MTGYADFEEFVVARRGALLRTAYLLTGNHHDAEDLVQSALIKVVPKWGRIKDRPEPYVRKVLARESVGRWRGRRWREVPTDVVLRHITTAPTAASCSRTCAGCRRGSAPCLCCATSTTSPRPIRLRLSASPWELSSRTSVTRCNACASRSEARNVSACEATRLTLSRDSRAAPASGSGGGACSSSCSRSGGCARA